MSKQQRLEQLLKQAQGMKDVPKGLKLAIDQLKLDLNITTCSLDGDGCLNCGS